MIEQLERKIRKAQKPHTCYFCGKTIQPGEEYEWSKCVCDGEFYELYEHMACSRVASAVYDYADPDEGLTDDDFHLTCCEICQCFICQDCPEYDSEEGCSNGEVYCIDRMDDYFKTHELYMQKVKGYQVWKCREKKSIN